VLAILGGTLVNNSRISDLNSSLNNRIGDVKEVLRAELNAHCAEADTHHADAGQKSDGKVEALAPQTLAC
jgi:hypothetical protein